MKSVASTMTEYVKAWQCIGCGSVEAPQTCIGVCEHRKVQFVYAQEHEAVLRELEALRQDVSRLRTFVQRVAHITPHDDAWQASYRALQKEASRLLGVRAAPGRAGKPRAKLAREARAPALAD